MVSQQHPETILRSSLRLLARDDVLFFVIRYFSKND